MAIIAIAPGSSIIASAVRNIFMETGIRLRGRDNIPHVKATSVAIGNPTLRSLYVKFI
jgi:hypothetical protein